MRTFAAALLLVGTLGLRLRSLNTEQETNPITKGMGSALKKMLSDAT